MARQKQTAEEIPDWESVPHPILATILSKVSEDDSFPLQAALVCKRWLGVVREVQLVFKPWHPMTCFPEMDNRDEVLVRGLRQFPNLTTVSLQGPDITGHFLGVVARRCPELRSLADQPRDSEAPRHDVSPRCCRGVGVRDLQRAEEPRHLQWDLPAARVNLLPPEARDPEGLPRRGALA